MNARPLPSELVGTPALARCQARAAGITDVQLQQSRLTRVTQGWYMNTADTGGLAARCRALAAALPEDAVFSDSTAAALYGLPLPAVLARSEAPAHVTLTPRAVVPRRKELVVHQRALPEDVVCQVDGVAVTAPARLFLDLAMALGKEDLAVVGDALLSRGLVTSTELADEITSIRRRRGLRLAREVHPLLDGRAQSPPESVLRLRLAGAGLPAQPQCPVIDGKGRRVGHVDLGYDKERVAVEYEGRHHAEGRQFDYDIDRYSLFAAAGWLVIRCGRRDLADGSETLIGRVRNALTARLAPR